MPICRLLISLILMFNFLELAGQNQFVLDNDKKRGKISFELINNLIMIPVEVNGVELSFLLDSGAANTVIFSFEERDSLLLNQAKQIMLRGLSAEAPIPAIKSEYNSLRIGQASKRGQTIYVVFDGSLRLSSRLGVPVHGIIGYDFLKDFVVEIKYSSKKIKFYKKENYKPQKHRKYSKLPLVFSNNKPYVMAETLDSLEVKKEVKLLIDSGSSDALWLFENSDAGITVPKKAFDDYLGVSINGNIYGKRSRVSDFWLHQFHLQDVNVAFPDLSMFSESDFFKGRNGSMGGDLLKRFNVVFDYQNQQILLKRNRYFRQPFYYNMSGLVLEQGSLTVAKRAAKSTAPYRNLNENENSGTTFTITNYQNYELSLERLFVVADLRKGSPAEKAGIQIGDEIVEIDNKPVYDYKLYEINELFYTKKAKRVTLKVMRNNQQNEISFTLEDFQ